jgi:hypothetical protein
MEKKRNLDFQKDFVMKKQGSMNYDEDELMEFLTKDFGTINLGNNRELTVTNSFGFI